MASKTTEETKAKAKIIWGNMDKSQKTCVRIGMFPADIMGEAAREGYSSTELSVAIMEEAKQNGGMIA